MSAEGLRNLVAHLQEDLMETVRQKEEGQGQIQLLQHKLEATENTVRHISRKLKSSKSPLTTKDFCFDYDSHPAVPRRSQSETSVHRGDHWSRISHLMMNGYCESGSGSQGLWYGGPAKRLGLSEWEPPPNHNCGSTHQDTPSPRNKSMSGLDDAKKQLAPSSPRLQRVRTLSSSCILSPRSGRSSSSDETQYSSKDNIENGVNKKTNPTDDATRYNRKLRSNDVTNSTTIKTTPPQASSSDVCADSLPRNNNITGVTYPKRGIYSKGRGVNNNSPTCERSQSRSPTSPQYTGQHPSKQGASVKQTNWCQRNPQNCNASINTSMHDSRSLNFTLASEENPQHYFTASEDNPVFSDTKKANQQGTDKERDTSSMEDIYSFHISSKQEADILSQLQHLLGEKEQMWKTKTSEIKHRMKKENFLLMQENELLQEEVKLLRDNMSGRDKTIAELKQVNGTKEEDQKKLIEEIKTLRKEKAVVEEDLASQDKELTNLDKTLCKLEITKKESDIEKRKKVDELEENMRELRISKKELERYKETNKSLKESLIKREASLQEQIFTVKKLRAERDKDDRQSEFNRTPDVIKTERDFQRAKSFNEKHSRTTSGHDGPRIVYKREGHHELLQHVANLKEELRISQQEIVKLKSEKERIDVNCNLQIADMEKQLADKVDLENRLSQAEFELKSKKSLDEEISSLRSQLEKKFRQDIKMRTRVAESEVALSTERTQFLATQRELQEKTDKLKKRDRQCQELCEKFGKLDSAYIKQTQVLRGKTDIIDTLKKRLWTYEKSGTKKYSPSNTFSDERNVGSKL